MKITITYCAQWNYLPTASSLEAHLHKEFGIEIELIAGAGGIFDVSVDGRVVFSKAKAGRFPEPEHIIYTIKNL